MRAIKTFVSGLLLSALLLLPSSLRAAELQPFYIQKVASINSLIAVAEKVGNMAGFADTAEFKEFIQNVRDIKGFDFNSIIGVAVAVNENDELVQIVLLPITDLMKAEIPSQPEIFDSLRPFLQPRGQGRIDINTPMGTYVALQKQGYLVVVPENTVDQIPADARKLFADLDKYTLGMKLDLEKVKFEILEEQFFQPLAFMAMMFAPDVAENIEGIIEPAREFYNEMSVVFGGIAFNPQTADVELSGTIVPRKGSDSAKALAGYKQQPTIFDGFRGTPGNIIASFGDSATQTPLTEQKLDAIWEPIQTMLDGFLEQIEMEDETGEISKFAEELADSVKKIVLTESKRAASDSAFSFNTDGTLLVAFDTASLSEIQKLVAQVVEFASPKLGPLVNDFGIDLVAAVKQEYVTVESFKISSFKFPMDKLVPLIPDPDSEKILKDFSPGVFWAVKDAGGKQAIAIAAGLDFAKAESAFKSALEKTKTPAPVQKPEGMFSVQGLGKFLQQTIYPAAEKGGAPDLADAKKVFDILASAGNDATATFYADVKPDKMEGGTRISGKAIQALISAVKAVMPEDIVRPAMRDF